MPHELLELLGGNPFAAKARTTWENAVNSVAGAERFLRERGRGTGSQVRFGGSASPQPSRRWKLGSKVRHAKYGIGTVLGCEEDGDDTKLTISFPGYGAKKLLERYAALEKL